MSGYYRLVLMIGLESGIRAKSINVILGIWDRGDNDMLTQEQRENILRHIATLTMTKFHQVNIVYLADKVKDDIWTISRLSKLHVDMIGRVRKLIAELMVDDEPPGLDSANS